MVSATSAPSSIQYGMGCPVLLGDGGDHLVQSLVELDRDGEAHPGLATGLGHVAVVEARVGPQHHRPGRPRPAHAVEHLGEKARRPPAGVGVAAPQAHTDDIVGAGHAWREAGDTHARSVWPKRAPCLAKP